MQKHRVLIVEDDPSWQSNFQEIVENMNATAPENEQYTAVIAGSYQEAVVQLSRQHFHLALIDLRLGKDAQELEGRQLVQRIKELDEGTNTIAITGYADATIATELLKNWDVFYLFEKGKDLASLVGQVRDAVSQAREKYRNRFDSGMDFLRGDQDIHSWAAKVLQVMLGASRVSGIDDLRNLRELLDNLLSDLYPLLYHRMEAGAIIDSKTGVVSARCWSKALGEPVLIRFGQCERIDLEVEWGQGAFAKVERELTVNEFRGVVYVPIQPSFEDFARDT